MMYFQKMEMQILVAEAEVVHGSGTTGQAVMAVQE
tara:strand:- start:35 stop:139 length:105 start_codon:yes stop_codon:yes gene_type:complete